MRLFINRIHTVEMRAASNLVHKICRSILMRRLFGRVLTSRQSRRKSSLVTSIGVVVVVVENKITIYQCFLVFSSLLSDGILGPHFLFFPFLIRLMSMTIIFIFYSFRQYSSVCSDCYGCCWWRCCALAAATVFFFFTMCCTCVWARTRTCVASFSCVHG